MTHGSNTVRTLVSPHSRVIVREAGVDSRRNRSVYQRVGDGLGYWILCRDGWRTRWCCHRDRCCQIRTWVFGASLRDHGLDRYATVELRGLDLVNADECRSYPYHRAIRYVVLGNLSQQNGADQAG